jgi:opacity protein-like surface antigen
MKKSIWFLLAMFGLFQIAWAESYPLGITAYSGFDVPVIQTDVGSGPMYGLAVRGNIWKFVHGELFFRGTSQGDVTEDAPFGDQTESITFKGGSLTGFGLNVLLAAKNPVSVWPYGLIGISSNTLKHGDSYKEKKTLVGYSFGGGLGINLYDKMLYLDINTALLVMPFHDNKASRKNWQSRAGIQYYIPIRMGGSN